MNVLLINGSPREHGCTDAALQTIADTLHDLGDLSETIWIGAQVAGCTNCRKCKRRPYPWKCVTDDVVNTFLERVKSADALIVGSPVYYGGITGQLVNFLTRSFYANSPVFSGKYAAGITCSRRAGNLAALSRLNSFFLMHSMKVVGSQYWNEVHGDSPEEMQYDTEGLQTMRRLAYNMHNAVLGTELEFPEQHVHTNFISREFLNMKTEELR